MTSAAVEVFNKNNEVIKGRLLLDTCATANFITDSFVKKLGIQKQKCNINVNAMNNLQTSTNFSVKVTIKSLHSNFQKTLNFLSVPQITEFIPHELIPRTFFEIPSNIKLADPDFYKPAPIDMLLGAGSSLSLFSKNQINLSKENFDLFLHKTKLGWVIGGGINNFEFHKKFKCFLSDINFDLEHFWQIEECSKNKMFSLEEQKCEEHFIKTTKRDITGRYIVSLPFKEDPSKLGHSRNIALRRLNFLLKRFEVDKNFQKQYTDVMNEHIEQNHISLIENPKQGGYFIPHHAVVKNSSNTTKLRIVQDASAKTSSGLSLNDILMRGPTIQDDLFSLLIRMRFPNFVIVADIVKMYLQFLVNEKDREYQKILWIVDGQIKEFHLNRIVFGEKSSPYLAVKCLFRLAEDEGLRFPSAAKVLKNDCYIDNIITGVNSIEEGQKLVSELVEILATAKLQLRQWACNDVRILKDIPAQDFDKNFYLDKDHKVKTLGAFWQALKDCFVYFTNNFSSSDKLTKRVILSIIAKIFDPLGLLGPIILFAKLIMQDIWIAQICWDEEVPIKILIVWTKFMNQLQLLENFSLYRQVICFNGKIIAIHCFSDACERSYGACIYVVSVDNYGQYHSNLLCSKSRTSPINKKTLPRLELCAALLLTKLLEMVQKALNFSFNDYFCWSDSTITLHWINTPANTLKTFVGNRVSEIQTKTDPKKWGHVKSSENPADALSRGQLPSDFLKNQLWLKGPSWLLKDKSEWPVSKFKASIKVSENVILNVLSLNLILLYFFVFPHTQN